VIRRCRACEVSDLQGHPGFAQVLAARASPPEVLYLWEDLTVTDLPLAEAAPMFTAGDDAWREMCVRLLGPAAQGPV
jgi:hypothetical protein